MSKTSKSFEDKWKNNPDLLLNITDNPELLNWLLERNGFASLSEMSDFLRQKKRILDAGCGNGRITQLFRRLTDPFKTEIVGVDLVSSEIAKANLIHFENIKTYQMDLLESLETLGQFDFIYCQEVIHHTQSPQLALMNLSEILCEGGILAIYVYKQKAPVREFTDRFIRQKISHLPYDEAMKFCHQITELGRVLSQLNVVVDIPEVELLEIQKGPYELQRFLYHFFMKCFWNDELSFDDNSVINYDWYHPQTASTHTLNEVLDWFKSAQLNVVHKNVDHYGITVWGEK